MFIREKRVYGYERLEDVLNGERFLFFFFSEKLSMKSTLISGSDYVQGNFFTGLDVSGYGGHFTK